MGIQDDFYRTQIRIPADIYGAIKDTAMESGRSINAEIIELLSIGLGEKDPPINRPDLADLIRSIIREELSKR